MVDVNVKQRAVKEIREAFRLLAKKTGVQINSSDLPDVEIVSRDVNPSYQPIDNKITMPESQIGDGDSYFEEASHALRAVADKKKNRSPFRENFKVGEFYGRIGSTLGREVTKGTDLDYLFKGPRPSIDSEAFREHDAETIREARFKIKMDRATKDLEKTAAKSIYEVLNHIYNNVSTNLSEFDKGNMSYEDLVARTGHTAGVFETSFVPVINKLNPTGHQKATIDYYKGMLNLTKETLDTYKNKSPEEQKAIVRESLGTIKKIDPSLHKEAVNEASIDSVKRQMEIDDLKRDVHHRKPYQFAEQYSADELLTVNNLYDLSDEEARNKFFHKPKKTLEHMAEAVLLAFGGLIFLYLVANSNITGYFIASEFNPGIGKFLGIGFFISLIVSLFCKFRRWKEEW